MKNKFALVSFVLAGMPLVSVAGDLKLESTVQTSYVNYNVDSQVIEEDSADTLSVEPKISARYTSKRLQSTVTASQQHLQRHVSTGSNSENFTYYNYSGNYEAIENYLNIGIDGQQSYRNLNADNSLVNDVFLGADQLSETNANSANFVFSLPRPRYVGLSLVGSVSKVKSDTSTDSSARQLNNDNKSLQTSIYSGKTFRRTSFNFYSNYVDTKGRQLSNRALVSRGYGGDINFAISKNWRFTVNGRSEDNETSDDQVLNSREISLDSYGAGFTWVSGRANKVTVTYNVTDREIGNDEEFIGLDVDWFFTSRTSLQANYGKRFFGDSVTFDLNHNTKHLRSRLSYSEDITSFSRLILRTESLGQFVCPALAVGLSDCFQPDTLDYELQEGEEFISLDVDIPDISDEVILSKSLAGSFGFDRRKVKASLNLRRVETDYLETDRQQTTTLISLLTNYKVGVHSSINWITSYSRSKRSEADLTSKTLTSTLGLQHDFNDQLSAAINYRFLDRESFQEQRDVLDRRLTLNVNYTF